MGQDCTDLRHTRPRPAGTCLDLAGRAATAWPAVSTPDGPATSVGVWRVCDELGGNDGGRHQAVYRDDAGHRHSRVFVKKADAKVCLAAADADRARGLWVDPRGGALPFRDWAESWFGTRAVRPTTSAGDLGRYHNHRQPAFGDLPLKDLTPMRIRTFLTQLSGRRAPGAGHRARCGRGVAVLGHASIVMTMDRYGHLLEVVDEQVLAALDVGLTAGR